MGLEFEEIKEFKIEKLENINFNQNLSLYNTRFF